MAGRRHIVYSDSFVTRNKFWPFCSGMDSSWGMVRGGFLSAKDRMVLQAVMRHPSGDPRSGAPVNAILLLDEGSSCADVAISSPPRRRYDTDRVQALPGGRDGCDEAVRRAGSARLFEPGARGWAFSSVGERLMRDGKEMAAYIAATWGVIYGHSGCVALLHRLDFEYKRPESLPAQADEARQAAFIATHEPLLNGLAVDFADAVHPEYQSRPAHGWIRKSDKVAFARTLGRQRLNPPGRAQPGELSAPRRRVSLVEEGTTQTVVGLIW